LPVYIHISLFAVLPHKFRAGITIITGDEDDMHDVAAPFLKHPLNILAISMELSQIHQTTAHRVYGFSHLQYYTKFPYHYRLQS
jgi:hypothetical protein